VSSHTLEWVFLGPNEAHSRLNRGHQSSDMAGTPLELGAARWWQLVPRCTPRRQALTTGQTGPQHDKRIAKELPPYRLDTVNSRHAGGERFRVQVLGRFRLTEGDTPITVPPRLRKPQELLQALIAFGGTEVSAGVLIDALWPDSEGDAGVPTHSKAHCIGCASCSVSATRYAWRAAQVSLNRDQWWVDMWEFEEELAASS